jgi:hypothetical protein
LDQGSVHDRDWFIAALSAGRGLPLAHKKTPSGAQQLNRRRIRGDALLKSRVKIAE